MLLFNLNVPKNIRLVKRWEGRYVLISAQALAHDHEDDIIEGDRDAPIPPAPSSPSILSSFASPPHDKELTIYEIQHTFTVSHYDTGLALQ
jgi:hypothetical protein